MILQHGRFHARSELVYQIPWTDYGYRNNGFSNLLCSWYWCYDKCHQKTTLVAITDRSTSELLF